MRGGEFGDLDMQFGDPSCDGGFDLVGATPDDGQVTQGSVRLDSGERRGIERFQSLAERVRLRRIAGGGRVR